ncbi:HAMP domain-containing protein [Hymenobacter taeanensis]|uniref:histidine kinase n=1 Tax=Hymenobacter taeanensis TaxID=2735321 RepID=A0A6M6BL36_9BACT|nr:MULTISPECIES: ATP-binding protein [Hymenobacter]QJX48163.1 HAMP domain-containing protein [Hymenobacter taeanensis]UOQ82362.1 ATP-binding protein [Hymenobacter sp. 5414T-23]
MTIRNRLTWLFLGLVAFILLAAMSVVYILQADYTHEEFHQRLRDRAEVTGYVFLEQDELRADAFRAFQHRYLRTLTGEVLQIYDSQLRPRFIEEDRRIKIPARILARILTEKEVYFDLGPRQAVGLFYNDNQGQYIIVAAAENHSGAARLRYLATILFGIFVLSLVVIYVAGRVFAGRALAPIAAVNDQVDRITAQDLHLRVNEAISNEQDELTRLARTFNRMLERLEDGFETQRTFVSNASHELRTPLTATIGELQVLLTRDRDPAYYREGLASVLHELQQMKSLINNLLELTQASSGNATGDNIRLDELLWEAREAVEPAQRRRVQITLGELPEQSELLEVHGNRQLLTRAIINLFDNALKYSGPEQPVQVEFAYRAGHSYLRIQDRGIGIGEKELPQIFQPFFRADNARGIIGHGVGLPLARRIVELHGGSLHITSQLGQGTVAEVRF